MPRYRLATSEPDGYQNSSTIDLNDNDAATRVLLREIRRLTEKFKVSGPAYGKVEIRSEDGILICRFAMSQES